MSRPHQSFPAVDWNNYKCVAVPTAAIREVAAALDWLKARELWQTDDDYVRANQLVAQLKDDMFGTGPCD